MLWALIYWTGTLRLNAKEAPLLLKVWKQKSLAFNPMEVRVLGQNCSSLGLGYNCKPTLIHVGKHGCFWIPRVCITKGNDGLAWRRHKGDPGVIANGIRRVSLLACRILVHLIKTVRPVEVMDTSPRLKWGDWRAEKTFLYRVQVWKSGKTCEKLAGVIVHGHVINTGSFTFYNFFFRIIVVNSWWYLTMAMSK